MGEVPSNEGTSGVHSTKAIADNFLQFDKNNDGKIDFKEFVLGL